MLEDTGYSMREGAGRLGPVCRKTPENSRSRKTGSGKRVDAGHQKSMTSGENRDSERGYFTGKRRPVVQSENDVVARCG